MPRPRLREGFAAMLLMLAATAGLTGGRAAAPIAPVPVGALPPASFANPQDAIVVRKETMKTDGKIFKAMKAAVEAGGDVAPFAEDAQWFVGWGKQIPQMFPKGSESGHDTKAKPDIWTDKSGFDRFAGNMVAAAEKLTEAAKANDKAAFAADLQTLGKACGGCHKAYAYPLH